MSKDLLRPRDHAEEIALFRAELVGALVRRELSRGELAAEIAQLAQVRYRPPGRRATKCYGASTIERWYYAYKRDGLEGLKPDARSDRGRARELTPEQRALLLDIRREHPGASVPLILRTLVLDGRLAKGAVSVSTVTAAPPDRDLRTRLPALGQTCDKIACRSPPVARDRELHMVADSGMKQTMPVAGSYVSMRKDLTVRRRRR